MAFGLLLISATWLMASCHLEIEGSGNGNLDGYWHLVTVDTLAVDSLGETFIMSTTDLSEQRFFWGVQGAIIVLYSPDYKGGQRYVSHFTHEDNTLLLRGLRYHDRPKGDALLEDVTEVYPFGVLKLVQSYDIEKLTSSAMVLRDDMLRFTFRKQ